ncbi:TM2 domain-containing protein [Candidatus Magnetominusculus dajiuhuensis]|uniref:TM2 domain-containing protein n=1 Tax=Candidatus Magnetominusculus dajiuhuensis TaxID=3137712 RepID=UPI003B42C0AD
MSAGKTLTDESPKSRLIALILCFLTGWLGGHRFYCNKVGTGIVMMLTMGGFGLWYFVDLVMISLGSFKDKDNLPIAKW